MGKREREREREIKREEGRCEPLLEKKLGGSSESAFVMLRSELAKNRVINPRARFIRDCTLRVPVSNCIPGNAPFPNPSRQGKRQSEA